MKRLLSKLEAAKLLGVSVRSIDFYRQTASLPYHVVGGKLIRFSEDELEQWATGRNGNDNDKDTDKDTDKEEGK